jgi:hypothetical protein
MLAMTRGEALLRVKRVLDAFLRAAARRLPARRGATQAYTAGGSATSSR